MGKMYQTKKIKLNKKKHTKNTYIADTWLAVDDCLKYIYIIIAASQQTAINSNMHRTIPNPKGILNESKIRMLDTATVMCTWKSSDPLLKKWI